MLMRTLVSALYILTGLAVLVIGFVAYRLYDGAERDDRARTTLAGTRATLHSSRAGDSGTAHLFHSSAQLAQVQRRLNELQASLDDTSAKLEKRTRELQRKNEEHRQLQGELDETLNLVFDMFAAESRMGEAEIAVDAAGSDRSGLAESQTDLERLQDELRKAEFLEQEQGQQIEELRTGLVSAEAEIAETQLAAEEELSALAAAQEGLEAAVAQSLIRTGKPSVPSLTRLLADERAGVRAWAAFVLGEIGPDAEEAATSLVSLLADPNEDVRAQSRQALAKIAPLGIR